MFSYYGDNFDEYFHENPTQLCSSCQWPQLSRELSMLKVQACTWWRPEYGYNGDDYDDDGDDDECCGFIGGDCANGPLWQQSVQ